METKSGQETVHESSHSSEVALCPNCNHPVPLSTIATSGASVRSPRNNVYELLGTPEERATRIAKMPPQAKAVLEIFSKIGKQEFTEADAMKAVADYKDMLRTKQDPWRIVQYYRSQLTGADVLRVK